MKHVLPKFVSPTSARGFVFWGLPSARKLAVSAPSDDRSQRPHRPVSACLCVRVSTRHFSFAQVCPKSPKSPNFLVCVCARESVHATSHSLKSAKGALMHTLASPPPRRRTRALLPRSPGRVDAMENVPFSVSSASSNTEGDRRESDE